MPVPDPRTGLATIWFISCFLFISIAVGGGFLLVYMIVPESETTNWLPIAGIALVCLPWLFWFCTCMYRIISRLFGFRMAVGSCGGAGGGGGGGVGGHGSVSNSTRGRNGSFNRGSTNTNNDNTNDNNNAKSLVTDSNDENGQERKQSSNSVASRESEMPLTSSMAP